MVLLCLDDQAVPRFPGSSQQKFLLAGLVAFPRFLTQKLGDVHAFWFWWP